jgi:hypothetical protein
MSSSANGAIGKGRFRYIDELFARRGRVDLIAALGSSPQRPA